MVEIFLPLLDILHVPIIRIQIFCYQYFYYMLILVIFILSRAWGNIVQIVYIPKWTCVSCLGIHKFRKRIQKVQRHMSGYWQCLQCPVGIQQRRSAKENPKGCLLCLLDSSLRDNGALRAAINLIVATLKYWIIILW